MKNITIDDEVITIKSVLKENQKADIEKLAQKL